MTAKAKKNLRRQVYTSAASHEYPCPSLPGGKTRCCCRQLIDLDGASIENGNSARGGRDRHISSTIENRTGRRGQIHLTRDGIVDVHKLPFYIVKTEGRKGVDRVRYEKGLPCKAQPVGRHDQARPNLGR